MSTVLSISMAWIKTGPDERKNITIIVLGSYLPLFTKVSGASHGLFYEDKFYKNSTHLYLDKYICKETVCYLCNLSSNGTSICQLTTTTTTTTKTGIFCLSNPCKNNATCSSDSNGFICQCTSFWTGLSCKTRKILNYL